MSDDCRRGRDKEPFKSLLAGDLRGALAGCEQTLMEIMTATHSNLTTVEFERVVKDWIATARHPKTRRLYTEMAYLVDAIAPPVAEARKKPGDLVANAVRANVQCRETIAAIPTYPRCAGTQGPDQDCRRVYELDYGEIRLLPEK